MSRLGRPNIAMLAGEKIVVLSNAQNVDLSALPWGPGVWASTKPKKVIVPFGVTIGSLLPATPAMDTGTGWGGQLTIIVFGGVEGAGGSINGGTGGTALKARANGGNKPRVVVGDTGFVGGGGGGGGKGGSGGTGQYPYQVNSGWRYDGGNYYQSSTSWSGLTKIVWDGSVLYDQWVVYYSITLGAYTYYRGAYRGGEGYEIRREYTAYQATVGGVGGDGGRGQGYAQSAQAGAAGVAGGTNAGLGATGGAGAARGATGSTGGTGAAGNTGAGVAGSTGGLAGWGIEDPDNVNLTNTGTIITRT